MFDPASVEELKGSPRLPAMRDVFKAIAANEPQEKVWARTGALTATLNAIERERIPGLVRTELKKRGY